MYKINKPSAHFLEIAVTKAQCNRPPYLPLIWNEIISLKHFKNRSFEAGGTLPLPCYWLQHSPWYPARKKKRSRSNRWS